MEQDGTVSWQEALGPPGDFLTCFYHMGCFFMLHCFGSDQYRSAQKSGIILLRHGLSLDRFIRPCLTSRDSDQKKRDSATFGRTEPPENDEWVWVKKNPPEEIRMLLLVSTYQGNQMEVLGPQFRTAPKSITRNGATRCRKKRKDSKLVSPPRFSWVTVLGACDSADRSSSKEVRG